MRKKILGMVLALCMLATFVPCVNAATVKSGSAGYNCEWVLDDSGTLIVSGSGNMYNQVLADGYGKQVYQVIIKNGITSIGEGAFYYYANNNQYYNMTSIEIPDSIKIIGKSAFENCKALRTINLPPSVTLIGDNAFENCSMVTKLTIPELVTTISAGTFQNCSSLSTVYLPEGITSIEDNAFKGCGKLTDIFFAGSAEQWNNIEIGNGNGLLSTATIHYNNAEGEYPYEISSLSLKSNDGEYITAVPENESCIVNIAITEKLSRAERDYVFIALYNEAEQLVGMNYVRADFSAAHGCEFGLNIPKQTESIKSIKAFIWNSFGDMTPLCEAKTITIQ